MPQESRERIALSARAARTLHQTGSTGIQATFVEGRMRHGRAAGETGGRERGCLAVRVTNSSANSAGLYLFGGPLAGRASRGLGYQSVTRRLTRQIGVAGFTARVQPKPEPKTISLPPRVRSHSPALSSGDRQLLCMDHFQQVHLWRSLSVFC